MLLMCGFRWSHLCGEWSASRWAGCPPSRLCYQLFNQGDPGFLQSRHTGAAYSFNSYLHTPAEHNTAFTQKTQDSVKESVTRPYKAQLLIT